jgi:uncharacterized protein YbaR (Trm112 family)/SAM-dependent methyltransferase
LKKRLLDILICPNCRSQFAITIFKKYVTDVEVKLESPRCSRYCAHLGAALPINDNIGVDCDKCYGIEIEDGLLKCTGCDKTYPIVNGIPRILPNAYCEFPDFVNRYRKQILAENTIVSYDLDKDETLYRRTRASFGYEWLKFEVTDKPENVVVFFLRTGIDQTVYEKVKCSKDYPSHLPTANEIDYEPDGSFLKDKLILEAGCGMGRYMDVAKDYGAEVVGIDLSRAVDRAHENLKNCRFVHVAQCNIMEAPFREEVFDFVYSIGVFMFIPNPRRAFESMVEYLKRGGYYAVWVYSDYMHPLKKLISNLIRSVTKRLPHRLLHFLCYVAVPFGYLQRILHKNRITRYLAAPLFLVPFSAHKKWRVRIADTFDWYSPEYHSYHTEREVVDWFEQNGFDEIRVLSLPVNIIGRRKWDSYLTQNR